MNVINVTISGPAGSGKTTIAERIQKCLDGMVSGRLGHQTEPVKVITNPENMTRSGLLRAVGEAQRAVVIREVDDCRVAACVNACDGFDTGVLEKANLLESAHAAEGREFELTKQRDQLLAALERLLGKAYKQNWNDQYPEELELAEAAIAAAKGGAA